MHRHLVGSGRQGRAVEETDTYPMVFGLEHSRERARDAAQNAQQALAAFDERADLLRAPLDFLLERQS